MRKPPAGFAVFASTVISTRVSGVVLSHRTLTSPPVNSISVRSVAGQLFESSGRTFVCRGIGGGGVGCSGLGTSAGGTGTGGASVF